jgi:8-oxo-dGTP diphosphatase
MRIVNEPPVHRAAKPHLQVACAIIESGGLVLATQRSSAMSLPLKWEFPGGKIREGESAEHCLQRELQEELGITAAVVEALQPSTHRYGSFTVTLHPFRCAAPSGPITLHEHAALAWVAPEDLPSLDWAAADLPVIEAYRALVGRPS